MRALLVVAAVALAVRIPWALEPVPPEADAADYLRLGMALSSRLGFVDAGGEPTAFRPPLYPAFVAMLRASPRAVCLAQAVLGAFNCVLVVALARRFGGPPAVGWTAGALLAIDPIHAATAARLQSELLYQTWLLVCLLLALAARPARLAPPLLSGVICGLAILTRSAAVPLVPVIALWLLVRHGRGWRAAGAFSAAALVTIAPWLVRNARVMGSPVLTTQGGITLYSSYRPPAGRILGVLVHDETVEQAARHGEVEADRRLRAAALRTALGDPLGSLRLAVLKVAFFWLPLDWEVAGGAGLVSPVYLFALPLAGIAAWRAPRRYELLLALFAALILFSAAVYGSPRLRFPYEPLVYLMSAGFLATRLKQPVTVVWAASVAALWLAGTTLKETLRDLAALVGLW